MVSAVPVPFQPRKVQQTRRPLVVVSVRLHPALCPASESFISFLPWHLLMEPRASPGKVAGFPLVSVL